MPRKIVSGRYKKSGGLTINKYNVRFNQKEIDAYRKLNREVENKRLRLLRAGRKLYGKDYKNYYGKQLQSLNLYTSKRDFKEQVKKLKRYASKNYVADRNANLFESYKEKIEQVFSDSELKDEMIKSLDEMGVDKFIKNYQEGEIDGIEFLYPAKDKNLSEYDQQNLIEQAQRLLSGIT